ncbi:MAG: metallophosphoesterase [Chitinophagaceae bacterium]
MQPPVLHKLLQQTLWLSAQRSVFWKEQRALIISDVHLGKTGHFRKAGIAVPQQVYKEDLQRLVSLLHYFNPERLIVVGDFFHSKENRELELFKRWRRDFTSLPIHLVKGNHDILEKQWYKEAAIELHDESLLIEPFYFSHDRCDNASHYSFCGHLHPGVTVNGLGKQSLRLPCFYFTNEYCVLPAFSKFTGTATVQIKKGDTIFAIAEKSLMKL